MNSDAQITSVAIQESTMRLESGCKSRPRLRLPDLARQRPAGAVGSDDLGVPWGSRRDIARERLHEGVLGLEAERRAVAALEADRGRRVCRQPAPTDRAGVV